MKKKKTNFSNNLKFTPPRPTVRVDIKKVQIKFNWLPKKNYLNILKIKENIFFRIDFKGKRDFLMDIFLDVLILFHILI